MCGYGNERGEEYFKARTMNSPCSSLLDVGPSSADGNDRPGVASRNCTAEKTCTCSQGVNPNTAGFVAFAAFCPDTCVEHPSCNPLRDLDDFMRQSFPGDCPAYAYYSMCSQEMYDSDPENAEWPTTIGDAFASMMRVACPASCARRQAELDDLLRAPPILRRSLKEAPNRPKLPTSGNFTVTAGQAK